MKRGYVITGGPGGTLTIWAGDEDIYTSAVAHLTFNPHIAAGEKGQIKTAVAEAIRTLEAPERPERKAKASVPPSPGAAP